MERIIKSYFLILLSLIFTGSAVSFAADTVVSQTAVPASSPTGAGSASAQQNNAPSAVNAATGPQNQTISMDLQDVNLKDVLKIFSMQSGMNFIASEAVQERKITLYLDKVPVQDAMNKLFKANNLSYEYDRSANLFIVKDWGKPRLETITKVFYLKYATVSTSVMRSEIDDIMEDTGTGSSTGSTSSSSSGGSSREDAAKEGGITNALKKLLSEYGSIVEDYRTNSLIVTDIPSRMQAIAQTIASLDVPAPQVLIEVEMLDVSKNTVDKLGFDFGTNPFTLIIPSSGPTKFFMGNLADRGKGIADATQGTVSFGRTYSQLLDYLRTQTDTKYLARPRLLTLNNETAEIQISSNESIGVTGTSSSTSGGTTSESSGDPERTKTGVSLRVTPQINIETGEITMFLYPKVTEATAGNTLTVAGKTYQFRDPEERSTKTTVRVKDGETVVIGGLIRNEFNQINSSLPFFSDIPILGAFFRHKDKTKDKERELLVFITPHILKEATVEFAQTNKAVLPDREQNTAAGFNRQSAVSSSLNTFDKNNR